MKSKRTKRLVWSIIGLYGLGVALFLVVRFAVEDRLPVIALVDTFLHLVVMPALILLPVSLITRHWRVALTLSPAVLFFFAAYAVRFIPRNVALAADFPTFKVLTYNLHAEAQ